MQKRVKFFFKDNKVAIISSICASVLTTIVILGSITAILLSNPNLLNSNLSEIVNGKTKSKTTQVNSSAEQSDIIDAVSKANPAVVSIVITKDVPVVEQYQQNPFYYFFNNQGTQNNNSNTEKQEVGGGSGFIVSSDGYIVTNNHVVEDTSSDYTVMTNDGNKYEAKVLAKDSTLDIAVIKIEAKNLPYLTFGNSDNLVLGQTAIAIGNALAEFQNSISMGIISGLSRSITASNDSTGGTETLEGVIQTDAAINPGNSGGPLLDINGNVIGVNVAVESNAENIGFALPGNMVKSVVDSVMNNGEIVKPYLGVRYVQVNESVQKEKDLSVDYGVLVSKGSSSSEVAVLENSPAEKAGIEEGDIILEIDGVKLDENKSLASIIRQKQVGQKIELKIIRDDSEKTLTATLEKAPSSL